MEEETRLLKYGKIITDDEWSTIDPVNGIRFFRVRNIILNGEVYYHKMVNGETVDIIHFGETNYDSLD